MENKKGNMNMGTKKAAAEIRIRKGLRALVAERAAEQAAILMTLREADQEARWAKLREKDTRLSWIQFRLCPSSLVTQEG